MGEIIKIPLALLGSLVTRTPLMGIYTLIYVRPYQILLQFFTHIGRIYGFVIGAVKEIPYMFKSPAYTVDQMISVGVSSLPLITVTSLFTGAIAVSQALYVFGNLVPLTYLGTATCKTILLELGPVLTALVLASRVGAGIAAELGTMVTNEQVDAMECLVLPPSRFLIMPRLVATIVMQVVLTIFADFIAILGGWFVAVVFYGVPSPLFLSGVRLFFSYLDIFTSIIKAAP